MPDLRDWPGFRRSLLRGLVFCCAVLMAVAAPARARPKTDVIILKSGDRFTGEIKSLDRGRLDLSTDSAGTISIEWLDVVEVTSAYQYQVETLTGDLLFASLKPAGQGRAELVGAVPPLAVALRDIVRLTPIGESFWQRIDGSLDLGFSYTQASGVAQLSVGFTSVLRRPRSQVSLNSNAFYTQQADADDSSRAALDLIFIRFLPKRYLVGVVGQFEENTDLGFDLRTTGAVLVGRELAKTNRHQFIVGAGIAVNREFPVDAPKVTNVEVVLDAAYSLFRYNTPKTNVDLDTQIYPSLSDTGRVRVEFGAQVRRELWSDFTAAFSVYNSYDNRPPTEGAKKNDVALSVSLGWTF